MNKFHLKVLLRKIEASSLTARTVIKIFFLLTSTNSTLSLLKKRGSVIRHKFFRFHELKFRVHS